jgi:hypothetical protein
VEHRAHIAEISGGEGRGKDYKKIDGILIHLFL